MSVSACGAADTALTADAATEKKLLEEYVESVNRHGVGCAEHTCGNPRLQQYVMERGLRAGIPVPNLEGFKREMEKATGQEIDPARKIAVFSRTLQIGPGKQPLLARLAPVGTAVALVGAGGATLQEKEGFVLLHLPLRTSALTLKVLLSDGDAGALALYAKKSATPRSLVPLLKGGPGRWHTILKTKLLRGQDEGAFAEVDFQVVRAP